VYDGTSKGELRAARSLARVGGASEHREVRLPDLREAEDIEGAAFPGKPPSYIPMRNSLFYSLGASYAEERMATRIIGGHNRDDLETFEDAGNEFFSKLQAAFWAGSTILKRCETRIERPLRTRTKPEVLKYALRLGVPFERTWSCHANGRRHCWRCAGCSSRARAFAEARIRDPLAPRDLFIS
jgi:7-cyano-7-deazaguanine synthase